MAGIINTRMASSWIIQILTFAVVILSVNSENAKDSEECKNQNTIKWPIPATVDGKNVNYMPMMPMAVPVIPGPKGERGEPGTCDKSECKCDCRGYDARHERRALRAQGNTYTRNRPNGYAYQRQPGPQNIVAPSKGQKGEMGVMGLTGIPGPTGPQGARGEKGDSGSSGTGRSQPGIKGDRGEPGIRGFPGATGLRGPSGPPGKEGRRGRHGKNGEQGLPGRAGSPGRQGEIGRPGFPGKPGLSQSGGSSKEKRAAFTAAMTDNVGPVNLATPIKFRDVILNLGTGYNLITGIFTAPYNGTYVLSYNALSQYNKAIELSLLHNARVISSIHSRETGGYSGAGNSIVVHLVEEDRLWIELSPGYYYVYGDRGRHTVFSGYLLYPD